MYEIEVVSWGGRGRGETNSHTYPSLITSKTEKSIFVLLYIR